MAVEDKFVNSLTAAGKKAAPLATGGAKLLVVAGTFEVAAADSNGSVYRLARLPANAVPIKGEIWADSAIDGNDWDLGLYKPGVGGAVVDADLLADGIDLSSGFAIGSGTNALKTHPAIDEIGKTLWELLGLSKPARQDYDLALLANNAGGAAGTISYYLIFALG
jgi:hypothetical protein